MSSRRLRRLPGIDQCLAESLESNNIVTAKDLFALNVMELVSALEISSERVGKLAETVASAITASPKSAWELLQAQQLAGRELFALEGVPATRVPLGTITEFVGPASVGKTQVCHMLCVQATVPEAAGGLGGAAIYVDTESTFSPSRLVQMAEERFPTFAKDSPVLNTMLSNVRHVPTPTCADLLQAVKNLEPEIIQHGVKLVVVDSVAAPVRREFDSQHMLQRHELLADIAGSLKYLAETFSIAVVTTNQVITRFVSAPPSSSNVASKRLFHDSHNSHLDAALGVAWAHAVNTRFRLEYSRGRRKICVEKSPLVPQEECAYVITSAGLQDEAQHDEQRTSSEGHSGVDSADAAVTGGDDNDVVMHGVRDIMLPLSSSSSVNVQRGTQPDRLEQNSRPLKISRIGHSAGSQSGNTSSSSSHQGKENVKM